ncbi:hypothetical protein [Nonomuraea insulae]|uniref:Uncharacterized protein n=1 Tax=Nonomuraea insulae TaxID=1616787 RepID=A0ABW1CFH2_9ACTN
MRGAGRGLRAHFPPAAGLLRPGLHTWPSAGHGAAGLRLTDEDRAELEAF